MFEFTETSQLPILPEYLYIFDELVYHALVFVLRLQVGGSYWR